MWPCWECLLAVIGYEALPVYILICYITAASNGYDFKFPWNLSKLDLSWLVDLPKWGRPQLQQQNRVLAVAQTVLRHSLGISLGECTSSRQESFTVDKFWSKSFVYSITRKRLYHTQGRYEKMLVPCFDPGLDWNTLSGLGYSTTAFLYPKQPTALHRHKDMYLLSISRPCHYQLAQHDTHTGTVLDLHYSGYKVLVIPTTKYIITGTDYHFVIKLKSWSAFCKILKERFLVMPITKECFKIW